jgi:hypothetical protein
LGVCVIAPSCHAIRVTQRFPSQAFVQAKRREPVRRTRAVHEREHALAQLVGRRFRVAPWPAWTDGATTATLNSANNTRLAARRERVRGVVISHGDYCLEGSVAQAPAGS